MSEQDIQLLELMKTKHKLIISEFNTIGSPTSENIREDFENLFSVKWTGWIGCYFSSLDPEINSDLPKWIVNNYKKNHRDQWPFHNAGIVFINTAETLVVLEEGKQLTEALPTIFTNKANRKKYDLPVGTSYSSWFDIMQYDNKINKTVSEFEINVNSEGKEILRNNNIPYSFPAIIAHKNNDYQFYYFSGNFCDNPISMSSSYFKGISFLKRLLYKPKDADRSAFFWNFYVPLMSRITNDYFESSVKPNEENTSHK
jgi:hypothetical protein